MTPKTIHSSGKRRLGTLACTGAALLALGAGAPLALAQSDNNSTSATAAPDTEQIGSRANDQVTLDPGTVIPVTLNTELTSNKSAAGDTFTATVDTSREAYNTLMQGATVDGVVRHATPQSGSDPGTLELAFTRLRLPSGASYPISGAVTSLDAKDLQVKSDGVLQAVKTNKDQSLTYAGVGAGAGALISVLSGGKIRIEDLLLGGGLGYAAGQLLKGTQQVHDVDLKPGTPVGVLLSRRVLYHRTTSTTTQQSVITTTSAAPVLRYYVYQGQKWSFNPATGARMRVAAPAPSASAGARRYYSYQGHPYALDLSTGKRMRLD